MKSRFLVLSDGTVFEGEALGADASCVGELVFTTGMCGYIETLTDPSYYGQIVMQTFPMIGNYGVIAEDFEGECFVRGYVVREACDAPSNFRAGETLDDYLKRRGIPGICGLDTRSITRRIREHGVMNATLCDAVPADLQAVQTYQIQHAVSAVTAGEARIFPAAAAFRYRVTLWDFGAKKSIVEQLRQRGCEVTVVPAGTSAEEILAGNPDGIMLSNGPGDPAENTSIIEELRKLLGKKPIFGICLGHQLFALAAGGKTEKLKYGHRGVNQPVRDLAGTRTYMTSQNHGYAVLSESLPVGRVRYENANDGTCEGVDYEEYRAFTVQFHPEAGSGPHDTRFLFDEFIARMEADEHAD
ncbi:MAG: carbamoyl phosphate synthase small subunit [Oscillospiraceae bacterium]|nr:carbamoyl phosphate synthase small subunit [Oscillospiraceae bacterium]